ncbi:hypothetical protein N7468_008016 [Penicillium chermesinum]|uniref:ER transporter 6TM N-terminal domain-containing protein n=1 Tax=Penicillium chermesinum TaxID=63820 RepID=A0A9W9TI95_9EURO|nr:uncharacterized protein N7468_008016 [Penicillium chermesinum]KAJ5223474.1 hypothetical protein N7468_008016 [Penicillium chermesinum]
MSAQENGAPASAPAAPSAAAKPKSQWKLPSLLNHFNAADLKTLFRCSVAAWVATLMIFIHPALNTIGIASFFATMVLFMVPPNSMVFVYILASFTLIFGMALGWGWGVITMLAAQAARPVAEKQAKLQAMGQQAYQQANATGVPVANVAQARLRASNPKFVLCQIFGTIVMDVYLTLGPLLPSFNGTIPKVFLIPSAIGIGLGLVCQIVFFPTSTSHVVLVGYEDLVRLLKAPLDVTIASLCHGKVAEMSDLQKLKLGTLGLYRKIQPALGFLPLDFSVGRWNAHDVKSLNEPLRQATMRTLLLLESHIAHVGGQAKAEKLRTLTFDADTFSEMLDEKKKPRKAGLRQLIQSASMVHAIQSPEHEGFRKEMHEALQEPSSRILPICTDATTITADSIKAVNSARWFNRPTQQRFNELEENAQTILENLRAERMAFTNDTTERLLQVNADLFDADGALKDLGLGYAFNWVFRKSAVAPVQAAENTVVDPEEQERKTKAAQESLRMSRGYRARQRGGIGRVILAIYHWLINSEGMYALRMVCVTIALGIPAVIPSSASFYYREKGLWALIMGQTTVLVYMSDFTLSLVSRFAGSVIGGVVGLVAWYIGSGNGNGNSYGLAAVMAVVVPMLMWLRIFSPPVLLQSVMMGCATCLLVVGYSFDYHYYPQYGNPGAGYSVFWRRLLLVLIGSAAAAILQLLPRPPSATRHVCSSLSGAVRSLTDHYALLLSCWGKPDREEGLVAEDLAFHLAESLSALDGPVAMLKLEFSSSPFDSEHLAQIKALCQDLNHHLARLLFLSASLPEHFQSRLAQHGGLLDHRGIGDIMAVLNAIDQTLKTGDPVPEVLPTPLLKRCLDFWSTHHADVTMSRELIRDEDYRRFCVAVSAYLKFLGTVDDLVLVIKGAVGESHIVSRALMHDLVV